MQLSLLPLDPPPCLRYFIRADGRHAGGITVHSVQGTQFSYGVAVSGDMRRRGVASSALMLLFETMKSRGFTACVVQIAPDNAASLALHRKLGFVQTGRNAQAVTIERRYKRRIVPDLFHPAKKQTFLNVKRLFFLTMSHKNPSHTNRPSGGYIGSFPV
ncbi:MAG: N-acetyltransferase family protein [Christensenellales bacterium]